jgi:hypothetical protein
VYSHRQPVLVRLLDNRALNVQRLFTSSRCPRVGLRSRAASDIRCLPWGSHCECLHPSHLSARHRNLAGASASGGTSAQSVIITDKAGHMGSAQAEERLTFWIDDAAKTLTFSDGHSCELLASTNPGLAQIAKISSTSSIAWTAASSAIHSS